MRQLSADIVRGGARPRIRNLEESTQLTRLGEAGAERLLVLDGVVRVDVDGNPLTELGSGAVIGERVLLEGGVRTSTVGALTPVRVAVAVADRSTVDLDRFPALAASHRREDLGSPSELFAW